MQGLVQAVAMLITHLFASQTLDGLLRNVPYMGYKDLPLKLTTVPSEDSSMAAM
jgi:hypothetical protein